jgi:hypothetical protein
VPVLVRLHRTNIRAIQHAFGPIYYDTVEVSAIRTGYWLVNVRYGRDAARHSVYVVGIVSRFMHNPGRPNWNVVKHIFRYLVGTQDYDIKFGPNEPSGPVGFTDSDYASCLDTRKSTFG